LADNARMPGFSVRQCERRGGPNPRGAPFGQTKPMSPQRSEPTKIDRATELWYCDNAGLLHDLPWREFPPSERRNDLIDFGRTNPFTKECRAHAVTWPRMLAIDVRQGVAARRNQLARGAILAEQSQ
jgi:hypothetical protein